MSTHLLFFCVPFSPPPSKSRVKILFNAVDEFSHIANKKKRWLKIVEKLKEHGVEEATATSAAAQYRTLKSRYYKAKSQASQSGAGKIKFGHFADCQEHFDKPKNRQLNPISSCSSLVGASGVDSSDSDSDHTPAPAKRSKRSSGNERLLELLERSDRREEQRLELQTQTTQALLRLVEKLTDDKK